MQLQAWGFLFKIIQKHSGLGIMLKPLCFLYNGGIMSKGVWRTINGRKVFIADGQTVEQAMQASGKFDKSIDTKKPSADKSTDKPKAKASVIDSIKKAKSNTDVKSKARVVAEKLGAKSDATNFVDMSSSENENILNEFNSQSHEWWKSIDDEQRNKIDDYMGNSHIDINQVLRGTSQLDARSKQDWLKDAEPIKQAIASFELDKDIKVYRRVNSREVFKNGMPQVGKTFTDKGFSSTSVKDLGKGYGDFVFEIEVPKGKGRGAYLDNIGGMDEDEFLMHDNSSYTITSVENGRIKMTYKGGSDGK